MQAEPRAAPPSAPALPARAPRLAPSAPRSACISPRGWRVSTRSPRPSGSHLLVGQQPGAPSTRCPRRAPGGAGHGVAAPGVCGAATRLDRARGHRGRRRSRRRAAAALEAAGTVCKLPALAGCARRRHTRPGRGRHSSEARPTGAEVGPLCLPALPFPTSPTSPRSWAPGSGRQGSQPGTLGKLPPSPAQRSANSKRPGLSGAVYKLPTLAERTSTNLTIPQPRGGRKWKRPFDPVYK